MAAFFFIEGAHLGFLQFVERQLFLFFPQSSRERKRDLFPRKSTARKEEKKREKGTHKTHTERDTERKKCACVCEKESVRDAKNEDSLENAVRILLHHVLVFFFSFFSPRRAIRFLLFLRLSSLSFLVADAQTLSLSLFLSMRRNAHETLLERRKSSTSRSTRRKRRLF